MMARMLSLFLLIIFAGQSWGLAVSPSNDSFRYDGSKVTENTQSRNYDVIQKLSGNGVRQTVGALSDKAQEESFFAFVDGFFVTKGGDNFVDGYRAVSKAEADDIAKHGFRPDPSGRSMQDKWFSETREGAEKFRQNYSDLDGVVKAKVPKDVYDRSYKHPNIDNTGPGFCVACDDLSRLKAGQ